MNKYANVWWIHDSWFVIRDSWFVIHDSWFMIRDSWFMIHDSWFMIHDSWFNLKCFQMWDFEYNKFCFLTLRTLALSFVSSSSLLFLSLLNLAWASFFPDGIKEIYERFTRFYALRRRWWRWLDCDRVDCQQKHYSSHKPQHSSEYIKISIEYKSLVSWLSRWQLTSKR